MSRGRKKPKIPVPVFARVGPIPAVTDPALKARISFERVSAGGSYCLSCCARDQVKEAIDAMRQLTSLTWTAMASHKGLRLTWLNDAGLSGVRRPAWLSPEKRIGEIRASRRFRILGYRERNDFVVLWFDPDHEATGARAPNN